MTMLATLGKYVQDSLQTNTAKELASDVSDIYYDYKRQRAIWCLSTSLLVGAGTVALFVAESATYGYFGPIVEQALPFLGPIGTKIGVGVIGFWVGGAFGHNAAKFTSQVFHEQRENVTNSAYIMTDADVERIVDANPNIYPQADVESGQLSKPEQIAELKSQLQWLIGKITAHKDDGTATKTDYKYPLQSALNFSNLKPLIQLFATNDKKREVRTTLAKTDAEYLMEGGAAFVASGRSTSAARELIEDNDDEAEPSVSIHMMPIQSSVPSTPAITPRTTVIYKHMERQANKKFYPVDRDTAEKGTKRVADDKRFDIIRNLQQQHQEEESKRQIERQIAGSLRRFF